MSNDYAQVVTSILEPRGQHEHRESTGSSMAPTTPARSDQGGSDQCDNDLGGSVQIRDATDADVPAIQQIYAHYVLHTFATFEEEPPTVEEMRSRKAAVLRAGLPYLVAEADGLVVGYSYATTYRARTAYRHTIEDSVYVAADALRRSVGRLLLSALIERCAAGPWRQMIAVIGNSNNTGSVRLHEMYGFRYVGTLMATGYKFGQWIDTALMQRELGLGQHAAPDPGGPADRLP